MGEKMGVMKDSQTDSKRVHSLELLKVEGWAQKKVGKREQL